MVSRRGFLGMLAALPAITALAGAGILLPKRPDELVPETDFSISELRYKATERYSAGFTDWRGVFGSTPSPWL